MLPSCEIIALYAASSTLGFCCLFAYNSFLASPSYLEHYYQFAAVKSTDNVSTLPGAKTPKFWDNISNWVTVLMMVPMFLLQFLMLSPWVLRQNVQIRMIIGAAFSLIAVLLVPVCAASGGVSEGGAIAVVIIACLLCGAATTTLESAQYAFFGSLPTKYMTGYVMGGGFSGSINSVLRIVITVGLPSTFSGVKTSAVIFFAIGMALMLVTMAIVLLFRLSPLVRSYVADYRQAGDVARSAHGEAAERLRQREQLKDDLKDDADRLPAGSLANHETPMNADEMMDMTAALQKEEEAVMAHDAEVEVGNDTARSHNGEEPVDHETSSSRNVSTLEPGAMTDEKPPVEEEKQASVFAVVRKIWVMMICLTGNMFTTLVLFPGLGLKAMHVDTITAADTANHAGAATWGAEAIMPMVVILMYNVGDTVGRLSINFHQVWVPRFVIPFIVVIRAIACVIPLALGICTPRVINSNANPIVVFLVLGITNGYLIGLTMAYGSSDSRLTTKERGIAGACMCFALLVGNTFGSVVSLIVLTQAF